MAEDRLTTADELRAAMGVNYEESEQANKKRPAKIAVLFSLVVVFFRTLIFRYFYKNTIKVYVMQVGFFLPQIGGTLLSEIHQDEDDRPYKSVQSN